MMGEEISDENRVLVIKSVCDFADGEFLICCPSFLNSPEEEEKNFTNPSKVLTIN